MRRHVLVVLGLLTAGLSASCGGSSSPSSPSSVSVAYSQTDLRVGTGAEAVVGRRLTVHYTGWLYDASQPEQKGRQFETSVGGAPYPFTLAVGQVIAGWIQGVPGMKVGGLRRLVLPPNLAYGSAGAPPTIPPNATLIFEVELIAVG